MTTTWITPPEKQGQIVEESYSHDGEYVYLRRTDRSDGQVQYYRSKMMQKDNGDYQNSAPNNRRWKQVDQVPA